MTPRARAKRPYFFEICTNPGEKGTFLCEITIVSLVIYVNPGHIFGVVAEKYFFLYKKARAIQKKLA